MSSKYLNDSGLAYFWSKIKAWCNAVFAPIVHNQASNTINAMTGYSKPSSGSAITTSDSLNQALGKLEVKVDAIDDSNYMHLTGNEIVAGTKTFSNIISGSIDGNAATATEADHLSPHPLGTDYEMTAADFPNAGYYSVSTFKDNTTSAPSGNVGDYRLYAFSGNFYFNDFLCTSPRQNSLFFGHFWEGVFQGWHELCTLDTDQIITGTKTFTKIIRCKSNDVTRGTAPSASIELGLTVRDSANNNIGALTTFYNTNKSSFTGIYAYNTTVASGTNIGSLGIGCDASGNVYTKAPTPATSDNSTQIATTAFVKNQGYITSSGNAATATKLATARTINGTSFDGSANITTASWGTARNISISDSDGTNTGSAVSVNGSDNATLKLPSTIKASLTGNAAGLDSTSLGSNYEMTHTDFYGKGIGIWKVGFKDGTTSAPRFNDGDFAIMKLYNTTGTTYAQFLCMSPRRDIIYFGKFWDGTWQKWNEIFSSAQHARFVEGNTIHRASDTSAVWVCGGTSISSSSFICVTGQSDANAGTFSCVAKKGSTSSSLVGTYDGNLTWNGQTIQTSSDARLKTSLSSVPDGVLDAWSGVDWGQFKFLAAIEEKGDSARRHVGLIAQQVLAAFDAQGMDACDYGIACHDVWDDEYYEDTVTGEKTLINKAGETWMIRYTEALCMEAAYQRRENARLRARIADLEERLAALELKAS